MSNLQHLALFMYTFSCTLLAEPFKIYFVDFDALEKDSAWIVVLIYYVIYSVMIWDQRKE